MPSSGSLLRTGVGNPEAISVEPFLLGSNGAESVEPFDLAGALAGASTVEPFDLLGTAGAQSVEPFDLAGPLGAASVEPFDLLGPADLTHPDGSPASPILGWWDP